MANKQNKEEKQLMKLAKTMSDIPSDRDIQVINTPAATLVLVNKQELFSVEWDFIQGKHYLLELSCSESVRKPIVR